jgi:hypothetical protein
VVSCPVAGRKSRCQCSRVSGRKFPNKRLRLPGRRSAKGTLAMGVRDEVPGLFADEQFASAFGVRGKPGISPGQLALVTVLQFASELD